MLCDFGGLESHWRLDLKRLLYRLIWGEEMVESLKQVNEEILRKNNNSSRKKDWMKNDK